MDKPDTNGLKIGPLWFIPGYSGMNVFTLLFACLTSISAIAYMGFIQPYLLTEVLHIPQAEQGALTGNLAAVQEIVVIMVMGVAGALSDRTGRKLIFVSGFLLLAAGYLIYPLANSVAQLYIFRCLFGVGAAVVPVMLSACIVDYIQEFSRARWLGVTSICNGLGVVIMATLLAKTPAMYLEYGADPIAAGRYAYWTATAVCLVAAAVLSFGLKPGGGGKTKAKVPLTQQLKAGLREGKRPRMALAFMSAFIGRGDLVVIGTFFSLWIVQLGIEVGMSTGDSLAKAGMLFGLIQLSAMGWAVFMGIISDKFDRVSSMALGLFIAAVGYTLMGTVADPFGSNIYLMCVILGIGEISVIISAGALLGQQAPQKIRGSVVGVFGLVGAIGILFASKVGGEIYDSISPTAPFVMMGILNAALMFYALWVRLRHGKYQPITASVQDSSQ
ncbi:MAG: MFS transporter [Chromatiales bacterium]|jgi:MFS family permease|nr:MFS transporter [Chromatiales bacterium]